MNEIGRHKLRLRACDPHEDPAAVPEYQCRECGMLMHVRKGALTNGQRWLYTRQGERHYKTRCNLKSSNG